MARVSVVIPSRNEPYLQETIKDLLANAKGDVEIFAVLDGEWAKEYVDDRRVQYLHFSQSRGMRSAINAGVAVARGEFILKTDAHCMFSKGWDLELASQCKDDYVVVPRRYALDPITWSREVRNDTKYPIDYCYLSNDLHGVIWKDRDIARQNVMVDDLMSSQGSVWFMKKDYFHYLELLDEATYGTFWQEFQEIGLKCWLSGGRVIVDKNAWYAHYHKVGSRGYNLPEGEKEKTELIVRKWLGRSKTWHKQKHDVNWLVRKFSPVPTWIT
jgi:glycosyltransferase involved in cell wall biosynthesis